jgi:hypothetical protein
MTDRVVDVPAGAIAKGRRPRADVVRVRHPQRHQAEQANWAREHFVTSVTQTAG